MERVKVRARTRWSMGGWGEGGGGVARVGGGGGREAVVRGRMMGSEVEGAGGGGVGGEMERCGVGRGWWWREGGERRRSWRAWGAIVGVGCEKFVAWGGGVRWRG